MAALKEMKKRGILSIGITNVVGSTQTRETDAGVYIRSGPEIAVASSKAFIGQVSVLALLAIFLGRQRKLSVSEGEKIIKCFKELPQSIREILKRSDEIKKIAEKYLEFNNFAF